MEPIRPENLRVILHSSITPHPKNPRPKAAFKKTNPKMMELTKSVKAVGVLQPITVRELSPNDFQVVMGERRYHAVGYADKKEIQVIVRQMTDDEALAAIIAENMQREDTDPILESATIALLLEQGKNLEQIASRFGKSYNWAYKRSQLMNLTPKWVDAHQEGTITWPIDHLMLIARYTAEVQNSLFDELTGQDRFQEPYTLESLTHALGNFHHDVSKAPWKADDENLVPVAGACTKCPKRASCQQCLFDDIKPAKNGPDLCTDHVCWQTKALAHVEAEAIKLKERYGDKMVKVSTTTYKTDDQGVMGFGDYHKAKRDDPGALRAIIVDGHQQGTTMWVAPMKSNHPANNSPAKAARDEGREPTKKELTQELAMKRDALNKRRILYAWQGLYSILEAIKPKDSGKIPWKCKGDADEGEEDDDAPANDDTDKGDSPAKALDLPKGTVPDMIPLVAWAVAHGLRTWFGVAAGGTESQAILIDDPKVLHAYLWKSCYCTMRDELKRAISLREMSSDVAQEIANLIKVDLPKLIALSNEAIQEPKTWKVQYGDLLAA